MGRPKRLYPLGKYRLRTPKVIDKEKAYPIELEYTWNRQIIRKTTNVFVKVADWNQNGNQGRGEIRVSYGSEFKRLNQLLLSRVERIILNWQSITRNILIRLLLMLYPVSSQTNLFHVVIKEKILLNSHWSVFLPIIQEIE